jgi:hypothetical protein
MLIIEEDYVFVKIICKLMFSAVTQEKKHMRMFTKIQNVDFK